MDSTTNNDQTYSRWELTNKTLKDFHDILKEMGSAYVGLFLLYRLIRTFGLKFMKVKSTITSQPTLNKFAQISAGQVTVRDLFDK